LSDDAQGDVTQLLAAIRAEVPGADDRLLELVYSRLHGLASHYAADEPDSCSLSPTALLHEALLRTLGDDLFRKAPNRAYLFSAVCAAMRRVLVEHARRRKAGRRGGGRKPMPLDALLDRLEGRDVNVVEVNDALEALAAVHLRASQALTLRMLGGFTVREMAKQLGVCASTVEKDLRFARAWLHRQLEGGRRGTDQ
jgi:RNA polymerase sigma factor (TIGR02999 family)